MVENPAGDTGDGPNPAKPDTEKLPQEGAGYSPQDPTRMLSEAELLSSGADPAHLPIGVNIGDFQLLQKLGDGAFASVYLAMERSLDRQVALKISRTKGGEARRLASLEHQHIVRVFTQEKHQDTGLYLICMQFVPGTDLERILTEREGIPNDQWTGQLYLDLIDRLSHFSSAFDPAAARDREYLLQADLVGITCWLGRKLAEGLAHAHTQGVIHQDIKPANILLNHYGQPLLSDFNMARVSHAFDDPQPVGGTIRYMAPEHLDAFNPNSTTTAKVIDERTDIYSLGLVLFEILAGREALEATIPKCKQPDILDHLAESRRNQVFSAQTITSDIPLVVDHAIQRCLEPEPKDRYQQAEELANVLEGCQQLRLMKQQANVTTFLSKIVHHSPVLMTWLLIFLPHLMGSFVNIIYNRFQIVDELSLQQQEQFSQLVIYYNLIMYPLGGILFLFRIAPILLTLKQLARGERITQQQLLQIRQRVQTLPSWVVAISCLCWLPGGFLFPHYISLVVQPVSKDITMHFILSFTISGLIATTYSWFASQYLVLQVYYLELWLDPIDPQKQAKEELSPMEIRLRIFQIAAGLIPLASAALLLGVGNSQQLTTGFRLLLIGLIGMGMLGLGWTIMVGSRLTRALNAITGR